MTEVQRIALFSPTAAIGGAERNLLVMCQAFQDRGLSCVVVLPPQGVLVDALTNLGIPMIFFPESELKAGQIVRVIWNCLRLWIKLRRYRPQLLHANSIFCMYIPVILGTLTRLPSIVHWADFDTRRGDTQLVTVTAPRNHVIAVSQAIKTTLVDAGVPSAAITVIHNGSPPPTHDSATDRAPVAAEFDIPADRVWVGITGRIDTWKGHRYAIDAMALLTDIPVHLVILGGGNGKTPLYEAEIQNQVHALGLSDRVTFTGFQSDPSRVVRQLDIVLCPSDYEPFGLVVTEAMAFAKPVIATETGGFLETVSPNETGLLIPPQSAAAIATAIRGLVDNPAKRLEMGRQGQLRYQSYFSVKPFIDSITHLYNQLI